MMNCTRTKFVWHVGAIFILLMAWDWFVHGVALMKLYQQTSLFWRSPEEMQSLWPVCILAHLGIACVITSLYGRFIYLVNVRNETNVAEERYTPRTQSLFFGISVGLLLGLPQAFAFISMPLPAQLVVAWIISGMMQGILSGLALHAMNSCKKKDVV